jgi:hypothetical protein
MLKSGVLTSLRRLFAFFAGNQSVGWVNERNRDVSTAIVRSCIGR